MAKKEFLYEQILHDMVQKIENGEYAYKQMLPAEREIAENYKANRTTVRRALELLAEKGYVEKIQGSGNQVVYERPENMYTNEQGEKTIGFFVPGNNSKDIRLDQPFYMSLYFYIELECREHNYRVVCLTVMDLDDFVSVTKQYSFAGALFMSKMQNDIVQYARDMGIPSVSVNSKFPGIPCVTVDNVNGGYLATKYLLDKGHRRIGFITGPDSYFTSEDRVLGVLKAMNERRLSISKEYMVKADWTYRGGYEAMKELLNCRKEEWPTAVFAFNEEMTQGAMKALREKGISIPENMGIVGFENTSITKYRNMITMIDSNMKQMAKTVSTLLVNMIDGCGLPYGIVVVLPVCLLEGGTVLQMDY